MSDQESVRASLVALRKGHGLTHAALAKHKDLMRFLGASDPREGVEILTQLAYELGDENPAVAERATLAIGVDHLKNTAARREALQKQLGVDVRTCWRAQAKGLEDLTDLILERYSQQVIGDTQSRSIADILSPLEENAIIGHERSIEPVVYTTPEWYRADASATRETTRNDADTRSKVLLDGFDALWRGQVRRLIEAMQKRLEGHESLIAALVMIISLAMLICLNIFHVDYRF